MGERERERENVRACVINEYHRFYRRYKIASKIYLAKS